MNFSMSWAGQPFAERSLPSALPHAPTRAQIQQLAGVMATGAIGPVLDLSGGLRHYFAPGMYGRELRIPAGAAVVGKVHRHAHLVQLLSGEATIATDQGRERIVGPCTWVSPAGVQRALVAHTDCLFFTFHLNPTDTQDLEAIEAYVIDAEAQLQHEAAALPDLADDLQRIYA